MDNDDGLPRRQTDTRHWSQRWLSVAIIDKDAIILYDLYKPLRIDGCGLCSDLRFAASARGKRYRVQRFWDIKTCPRCGRLSGYGRDDETLYLGDSEAEAIAVYKAAVLRFQSPAA